MITVIIAGGSGSRLWPLSTPDFPKHLLALTGKHALVNYAYERAITFSKDIYVITEASHSDEVRQALPDLPKETFIIEPGRRGTASCIVAALEYISERHDKDEPIAFMPADHYVRDTAGFTRSFKVAADASKKAERIVLVGVEPDHPATGFGYIQKDGLFDEKSFIFNIDSFHEKPDYETARKYLASGKYLWNCGYFVGSVNTFVETMKQYAPDLYKNYEALVSVKSKDAYKETYLSFENIAIDYALIEKAKNLLVVPANFDWMDLGSYHDLHKAVESDSNGNHTSGENIELEGVGNSYVRNEESDKPVAVIGLDNVAVVNTPNGILVTRKDLAQKVGDVSKRFKKD
jgi:mannose-1-phosphate guanylyltransferase